MGQVRVHGADVKDGRVERLRVKLHNLPARTIDRDTAIAWMRDGHSFLPVIDGDLGPALQLVEVVEDDAIVRFVRDDHAVEPADQVPGALPGVAEATV